MSIGIMLVTIGAGVLMWAVVRWSAPTHLAATSHSRVTAIDEAERILTARYASGDITPGEYRKALSMLRT